MLYHTWFRTGSAYTSNGITEFLKEVKAYLPDTVEHIFFRADSGYFSGALFDLLESFGWSYLVKVKLKNLKGIQMFGFANFIILPNHGMAKQEN